MPYNTKKVLVDLDKKPIPQVFDPAEDSFKPLTQMQYYGNSSDTKPTNVTKGSAFLEIDTQAVYVFDGVSWVVF